MDMQQFQGQYNYTLQQYNQIFLSNNFYSHTYESHVQTSYCTEESTGSMITNRTWTCKSLKGLSNFICACFYVCAGVYVRRDRDIRREMNVGGSPERDIPFFLTPLKDPNTISSSKAYICWNTQCMLKSNPQTCTQIWNTPFNS